MEPDRVAGPDPWTLVLAEDEEDEDQEDQKRVVVVEEPASCHADSSFQPVWTSARSYGRGYGRVLGTEDDSGRFWDL